MNTKVHCFWVHHLWHHRFLFSYFFCFVSLISFIWSFDQLMLYKQTDLKTDRFVVSVWHNFLFSCTIREKNIPWVWENILIFMLFILWRVFKGFFCNIGVKLWLQPPMKHQPCETQSCHYSSNHMCLGCDCGQIQPLINSLIMCFTKEKEQNTKTQTHHWTSPPVTVSTIHCMLTMNVLHH